VTVPSEDRLIYDWASGDGTSSAAPRTAMLDDETLRDGLQSPSVKSPPIEDKLRILHLMERLGLDTVDIGLPGAGPMVVKDVTRQTWRNENLSGRYYGGNSGDQTSCGADTGYYEEETFIEINHAADNSITMTWTDLRNRSMNFNGTYSQSGHMGQIVGTGRRLDLGLNATVNLFEIERTISGITGRGHIVLQSSEGSCTWDGRWGGVRR